MFVRAITKELKQSAKDYPVVTMIGPRQSGKTTLVQRVFPRKPYVNLELPDIREFASMDPQGFLAQFKSGAVLDEIQRVPVLLSYIQDIVDRSKRKGMFILTGSHQLELHEAVTQSLAGRTAILKLLPLSIAELATAGVDLSIDEYLLRGFFPRIYHDELNPTKAYGNYLQTYVERDVRRLINVKDLAAFQTFLRLCASRVGQVLNISSLGNDLGVANHTIKHWLSVLEASFLIIRLQPYFENFGKRIIKAPKLYFTDVGFAAYLLGIETISQISRDPLRGNLLENLVVLELVKMRLNAGLEPQFFYYRDSLGNEVDVIFKYANELIPIEIKAAQTMSGHFFKGLEVFKNLAQARCGHGFLVYTGEYEQKGKNFSVLNYKNIARIFALAKRRKAKRST